MSDERVTMEDYLDSDEDDRDAPTPASTTESVDTDPHACEHCGRSFDPDHWGVRASKVRRKHEQRCGERDPDA